MEVHELKPILEALLFAAETPLSLELLAEAADAEPALVHETLVALAHDWEAPGRGVRLSEMAGGWIALTREEYAPFVGRLLRGKKKMRLSRPALETLAIIAYKQPVTKAEVDAIRGVDSSGVLNTLLERALVTIRGRSKALGRPLLYGTTGEFLSYFGLKDLSEMPRVEELKAIVGEKEPENPEAEPELFPAPPGVETAATDLPDDPVDFALAGTDDVGDPDGDPDAAVVTGPEADLAEDDEGARAHDALD